MVIKMKNYLMIENNIVSNICLWDGDVSTWQPPKNAIMLIQETTSSKNWDLNEDKTDYVLTNAIGGADIGFIYENGVCITNQPKPDAPIIDLNSGEIPTSKID